MRFFLFFVSLACAGLATTVRAELRHPLIGEIPVSVVRCHFQGYASPSDGDMGVYREEIRQAIRFWNDVADGQFRLLMRFQPWVEMQMRWNPNRRRGDARNECLRRATWQGALGSRNGITLVLMHPFVDVYGNEDNKYAVAGTLAHGDTRPRRNVNGNYTNLKLRREVVAHELGHALGLPHAMGNLKKPTRELPYAYGDNFGIMGGNFGNISPYTRERLGLYEIGRIFRFGWDGSTEETVTLADPDSNAAGYHAIRIPIDETDTQRYLMVEWARKFTSVERQGRLPGQLYIYEVGAPGRSITPWGETTVKEPRSVLLYRLRKVFCDEECATNTPVHFNPIQGYDFGSVQITLVSGGSQSDTARVRNRNTKADWCVRGYRWREAVPGDKVCAPAFRRDQVARENATAASQTKPDGSCVQGAVWREATGLSDKVCVTPASRAIVAKENAAQTSVFSPRLAHRVLGPNTCRGGYVWREAHPRDWVCVAPERRDEVRDENRRGPSRRRADGTCLRGFVWRETHPADKVCVPLASRSRAAVENRDRDRMRLWKD